MRLLLDENLSPRLVQALAAEFPGTTHVDLLGRRGSTDRAIWELARDKGYVLVSKDNDFRQRGQVSWNDGRDLRLMFRCWRP